jgi:hypothetical protein
MIKKLHFSVYLFAILFMQDFSTKAQNAIKLDGTNDYIQTNYSGILGSAARSVEAWIKTTSTTSSAQKVILDWGSSGTGGRFTLNMLQNNSIRLEIGGSGIAGTLAVNNGQWHHVAAVYDPTATNTVSLYIDGVLNISGNFTIPVNTIASANLKIGQRFDGVNYFNGSIDEVRVWNVARTATEINANKNVEFCSPQAGLVAYYKFNDGIANGTNTGITTVSDYSGNNYTGTLNGFGMTGTTSNLVPGATLNLNTIDTTVTDDNAGTLTANQANAMYQWVNCGTATPISGATSQSFSPTTVGVYGAIINFNGCISTTVCTTITTLETNDFGFSNTFKIYPNPTTGLINIQGNEIFENIEATVKNVAGQVVNSISFFNVNSFNFDINSSSGIYFLTLKTNTGKSTTLKLIKL